MMKWTDKQVEIIELRNRNILVSAAAGSGKTAVLVERIKQLILKDHVPVDHFLITTFTNAAAAEMKERLEKAIRDAINEPGADEEFLKRQLRLMPGANISTFHSFTIEVMKRYYYLTDLEPGVRIGDDTQIEILKRDSIDQLFDRRFAEDYENFTAFLKKYSSHKSERSIKDAIVGLYNEMRSIPHYMKWARQKAEILDSKSPLKGYGLKDFVDEQKHKLFEMAYDTCERAYEIVTDEGLEKIGMLVESIYKEMQSLWDYHAEHGKFPEGFRYTQIRAPKEEKEDYAQIKDRVSLLIKEAKGYINQFRDNYSMFSEEECDDELRNQSDDLKYLLGVIEEFEGIFASQKAELVIVDFDDVMHYAIDILDDEVAAAEYRNKFQYIFIDEYQDCNKLQETIAEKISRGNNLFMVGDLKQSIYRFRLAEPELFRKRYHNYAVGDGSISCKIDLNSNFRSKRSVTDTVNAVFENIMEDYDENAKLHCTVSDEYPGMTTEMYLINKEDTSDENDDMSDSEAELVAKLIREHRGIKIHDMKQNIEKTLDYGDIVILTRGNKAGADLERYLNDAGIPALGEAGGGYFDTVEIQVFMNILKIISNTRQDVALISAMKSVAFGFNVRQLARIRAEFRDGSYYDAVRRYETEGSADALRDKVHRMLDTVRYWKQLKNTVSIEQLVTTVLDETGYYDYCSGLPLGEKRVANIRLLVEKAAAFEESNYSGLYGFLSYVEALQQRNIRTYEAKTVTEGEQAVRIMTIHKSKGLEFPVVILAGMNKSLGGKRSSGIFTMHKDYGIALSHVSREEGWHRNTLLQKAIAARKAQEETEEEIRILYVALTRAKDKLILTGLIKSRAELDDMMTGSSSYLKMVYETLSDTDAKIHVVGASDDSNQDAVLKSGYEIAGLINESIKSRDDEIMQLINDRLSFVYPHERKNIRSKYTVSELNRISAGSERMPLDKALFASEKRKLTAAQIGTAMHSVMERIEFGAAAAGGEEYIASFADQMAGNQIITLEERKAINTANIAAFFDNPVGKRAAQASKLCKEREFILNWEIDGVFTTVQGIIDCYFEEDDGLVLIDYKNSFTAGETGFDDLTLRYQGQIRLYKRALQEATGKPVKEAYLYLFGLRKFIKI